MRLLLDECLPRQLARELEGHDVRTVGQQGWKGIKNGALLRRAARDGFDVFITVDQKLPQDHDLPETLAVVLLRLHSNHLDVVKTVVPDVLDALGTLTPGDVRLVQAP